MNDGVTSCISVLRSVFQHLEATGSRLALLSDEKLLDAVRPFGEALKLYLGATTAEERKALRTLRGVQGQTTWTRRSQQAIHELMPTFLPLGLKEFLETEKSETNPKAAVIVAAIEYMMRHSIYDELVREFGTSDDSWWTLGVPKTVRLRVARRHEQDDGKSGGRENYFDVLDCRAIIKERWELFRPFFGRGKVISSKEKQTLWLSDIAEIKKTVEQAAAGKVVSLEELSRLQEYREWMRNKLTPEDGVTADDADMPAV